RRAPRRGRVERQGRRPRRGRGRPAARARPGGHLAGRGVPRPDVGGAVMTALVRSELFKLRTTRTALGLLAGMVALIVLFTLLNGLVTEESYLFERKNQFQLLANGS